jgi:endonuclease/exonuclease/phosphatase family metal-dependent hydrolase
MVRAPKPDVLIISNTVSNRLLKDMAVQLGPEYTSGSAGGFAIVSRLPVIDTRAVSLDIPAEYTGLAGVPAAIDGEEGLPVAPKTEYLPKWSPVPRLGSNIYDPGHAVCVRIDATEQLGRELVIWALDLPSQPRAWRMEVAEAATARLYTEFSSDRFAGPGIILGDMNTPRGSASLELVSLGYPHAFEEAGRGYVATWPRHRPLFHIDHMYIAPGLRAASYETIDMGISEHRAQTAEITTATP